MSERQHTHTATTAVSYIDGNDNSQWQHSSLHQRMSGCSSVASIDRHPYRITYTQNPTGDFELEQREKAFPNKVALVPPP